MKIDLHVHTTRSDGSYPPEDVLDMAIGAGIDILSITDHDTLEAHDDLEGRTGPGLTLIPGVEFTTHLDDGEIHILGYFPAGFTAGIRRYLEDVQEERRQRIQVAVARLEAIGIDIEYDEILAQCGGNVVSRSHVAAVMVKQGNVSSYRHAFSKYLASHHDIIPPCSISPERVIPLIRQEGGIPVWAHPVFEHFDELLEEMIDWGIRGIEAYGKHGNGVHGLYYQKVAEDQGLLVTGGSDWHGHDRRSPLGKHVVDRRAVAAFLEACGL